jgi:hypothetical protein
LRRSQTLVLPISILDNPEGTSHCQCHYPLAPAAVVGNRLIDSGESRFVESGFAITRRTWLMMKEMLRMRFRRLKLLLLAR